jgi:hypothetical protein
MTQFQSTAPAQRTPFDRWLWEKSISNVEAGRLLGCHAQTIRLWRRPFGDAQRRVPGIEDMRKIVTLTGGEVVAADFYPPDLQAPAAAAKAGAPA